jgi:hypothetical protein
LENLKINKTMKEINENNNVLNQESNPKKEWITPDLEIMKIEGGTPTGTESGTFGVSV